MTVLQESITVASRGHRLFSFTVFVILASLDNAAAGILPPLYAIVARDLNANEAALGGVTAVYVLVAAAAAVLWGYRGDRGQRKLLLLYGTLIWAVAMFVSGYAQSFAQLLLFQVVTGVGVGCVGSVGFSVVSDLIPVHRRGLALSLWSMSQAIGGALGALLASSIGVYNWRWPFWAVAVAGLIFALLYRFADEPQRGQAEPELARVFAAGKSYTHRIAIGDLRQILLRRANVWLISQSFFFSLAYGSTFWIPRWAIARVQAEGYTLETATIAGNLFVTLFGVGAFFAIPAGHLGDRWQRQNPRGRLILAASGLLGSIPFFVILFFLPLKGVVVPQEGSLLIIARSVIVALFTNGWVMLAFLVAFCALALYSADPPNWAALITSANLPEHRGTVIGITRLVRAVASALSVGLAGLLFTSLTDLFPSPHNYAVGLALFQLLVIPAALCYVGARKTIPQDIAAVKQLLAKRAQATFE